MKANKNARENNNSGVSSVVGTVITIPIAIIVLAAVILWANNLINPVHKYRGELQDIHEKIERLDFNITLNVSGTVYTDDIIWMDDYEAEKLQWHSYSNNGGTVEVNYDDNFYTKGHSIKIETPGADGDFCGIKKSFAGQTYNNASIETWFTIDTQGKESYKYFNISQDNVYNFGSILIDINNNELKFLNNAGTYTTFASGVNLFAHEHCWHYMRLVVDFRGDGNGDPRYISFNLDDREYGAIRNNPLNYFDSSVSQNPRCINVSYMSERSSVVGAEAVSYVDDFVFRKLTEYNAGGTTSNNPPIASDNAVDTPENTPYVFDFVDYNYNDPEGIPMDHIEITSLNIPAGATLQLFGIDVNDGDTITLAQLNSNNLIFTPATGATGSDYASYDFRVNDGVHYSQLTYLMTINVISGNIPPTVLSTIPSDSATNVPINQDVAVVFSETMDTAITPALSQTAGFDPGNWVFQGWSTTTHIDDTATWTHDSWGGSGSIGFNDHIVFNNADDVWGIVTSDIDGDNDIDVISASYDDNIIRWHENIDGLGTFIEHTIYSNAPKAVSVFAADIDGDNDMDVIGASFDDSTVRWFENTDGQGTFTDHIITTIPWGLREVFADDIDGDNDMDVICTSYLDDHVRWFENTDGQGSFVSHVIDNNANGAKSLYTADIDGDNDIDVISGTVVSDNLYWYENTDGQGSFTRHTIDSDTDSDGVYAADIDGDNDIDIVNANGPDHTIKWYENTDGLGTFNIDHLILNPATCASDLYGSDFDGDLDLDILSATSCDNKIRWYANTDGLGTYSDHIVDDLSGQIPRSVYAADIDNDGDIDALSSYAGIDQIKWYENTGLAGDSITLNVSGYYDTDGNLGSDNPYSWSFITMPPGNNPPTASFTYLPNNPTTSNNIQFTDTSIDSDGTIVSWDWDFDDGTTSTQQHPTHNYAVAGTYTVTLTVTDNDGGQNTFSDNVQVIL